MPGKTSRKRKRSGENMTLDFADETNGLLPFDAEALASRVIDGALDYMNCPYEANVSLTITDEEEIHRFNLEFRKKDSPTDVLSFPMAEISPPGNFACLDEMDAEYFDPESGELVLGDIVICAPIVIKQANAYGHSVMREYAFLITHSILHLLGYDHMNESDAREMEELQSRILEELQISRE